MKYTVTWVNSFPPKGGISSTISPRTLITGLKTDYNKMCKLEFGSYAQVHDEPEPTNSMIPRTSGAICLGPNNTLQGGYKFLNLNTGRMVTRRSFTELPITNDVINRVEALAEEDSEPIIKFSDKYGNIYSDATPDIDGEITGVKNTMKNDDIEIPDMSSETSFDIEENDMSIYSEEDQDDIEVGSGTNASVCSTDTGFFSHGSPFQHQKEISNFPTNTKNTIKPSNTNIDKEYTTRSGRISKRVNNYIPSHTGKKYSISNFNNSNTNTDDIADVQFSNINIETFEYDDITAVVITKIFDSFNLLQYNLNKGIKVYGERGREAAFEEISQLHKRNVFNPISIEELTALDKKKALGSLIFLKEKKDGTIKGRACADGRKQRVISPDTETAQDIKLKTASPTVALESVLLTAVIEAAENRDVAILDIPNAFVQTDMEGEKVVMKLRGELAELLVRTAPELYRKYITDENGKPVLYVELLKALYGCLQSALLFYKKLVKDLLSKGFMLNPYDPCVANKDIEGSQFTVVWHVDDLKISHAKEEVVSEFISWIKSKYEDKDIGNLKTSRGKIHDYLGMKLDYTEPGKVKISMVEYITDMLNTFSKYIKPDDAAATPAAIYLFNVRDTIEKLNTDKAEFFHTMVAKGLFVCKRARPDIQLPIAFLSTRVKEPDIDDWKKLTRMMKYLNKTKDLVLILNSNNTNIIKWWIDAAYAVHPNMRSHTGGCMSLGGGMIYNTSIKQKLNVKSSTEAELVAVDDILPQILWTNYFLYEQGFNTKDTVIYQDNKSAILLEKNGKNSSSRRTKHINIRYFFVKDRNEKGEINIEYCPTDIMIADFYTKPLQGKKFLDFRNMIMNN